MAMSKKFQGDLKTDFLKKKIKNNHGENCFL